MNNEDYIHELEFWKNYTFEKKNFLHRDYYCEFFPLDKINGKILEIGCGGAPFYTYCDADVDHKSITLVDPILKDLSLMEKYFFLNKNYLKKDSFFNLESEEKYDYIICLNVLDHFEEGHDKFLLKIKDMLNKNGRLFLYYDIRSCYSLNHYAINPELIRNTLVSNFSIIKEDYNINPVHINWSMVYSSHRVIAEKMQ